MKFVNEMQEKLENLKNEIMSSLDIEKEEFDSLFCDKGPKDTVDVATEDIDRGILEKLGTGDLNRLKLIESALGRIYSGHYGHCFKCSESICRERLIAIPYALFCIDCKSKIEKK